MNSYNHKYKYFVHLPRYADGTYHALLFKKNKFVQEICSSKSFEDCMKQAYLYMELVFIPTVESNIYKKSNP